MNGLPYAIHHSPNLVEITIGELTIWFSYRTPIAYAYPGVGIVARANDWGPTTGRHLAAVGVRKEDRIPGDEFERHLRAITDRMRVTV